jgi:hypothetical protein
MDQLTSAEKKRVATAFLNVRLKNGRTMVDDEEVDEAEKLIDWFAIASGTQTIGLPKTRVMINRYEQISNQNLGGRLIKIAIRQKPQGTVTLADAGG